MKSDWLIWESGALRKEHVRGVSSSGNKLFICHDADPEGRTWYITFDTPEKVQEATDAVINWLTRRTDSDLDLLELEAA